MKNIHLLKTNNKSRLYTNRCGEYKLHSELSKLPLGSVGFNLNIYMTSEEDIKEEDWWIDLQRKIVFQVTKEDIIIAKADGLPHDEFKKIILTDNEELIKDGVQAVPEEFLEWFVKNPDYENIEFEREHDDTVPYPKMRYCKPYKIILPKELGKITEKGIIDTISNCHNSDVGFQITESKQELEEAAENNWDKINSQYKNGLNPYAHKIGFIESAKWQSERSISKEEYEDSLNMWKASNVIYENIIVELQEQIKKMYKEEEVRKILDTILTEYRDSIKNKMDYLPGLRFSELKK